MDDLLFATIFFISKRVMIPGMLDRLRQHKMDRTLSCLRAIVAIIWDWQSMPLASDYVLDASVFR